MRNIVQVKPLPGCKLQLRFDDGAQGEVDLSAELQKEVFAAWKTPGHFESVRLAHGGRALEWPGEIDLCADALYLEITGMKVEELFPRMQPELSHA